MSIQKLCTSNRDGLWLVGNGRKQVLTSEVRGLSLAKECCRSPVFGPMPTLHQEPSLRPQQGRKIYLRPSGGTLRALICWSPQRPLSSKLPHPVPIWVAFGPPCFNGHRRRISDSLCCAGSWRRTLSRG